MSGHTCKIGDRCCNGEGENFWINDLSKLFCSLSPVPRGNLSSGERLNAVTRFILYLFIVMIVTRYKYAIPFLILGLIFILLLYKNNIKDKNKEDFAFFSLDNNKMFPIDTLRQNPNLYNLPNAEATDFKFRREANRYNVPSINDNYKGSSQAILKANRLNFQKGERVENGAGIQYFPTKSGVNRKTMIEPVIEPRIMDKDVWGQSRIARDAINSQLLLDVTDDSRIWGSGNPMDMYQGIESIGLGSPVMYETRAPNGVVPMNSINDNPQIGRYGSQEILYDNQTRGDFMKNTFPIYEKFYKKINNTSLNNKDNTDTMQSYNYSDLIATPAINKPVQKKTEKFNDGRVRERFDFVPLNEENIISQNFGQMGQAQKLDPSYNVYDRLPKGSDVSKTTPIPKITDQLLSESPTYVYNDKYFNQPSSRLYLQDIQPKLYSYAVDQTPINSNIGITYSPQQAPRFKDQVASSDKNTYPLYTRIDPQLVREDGTPGQIAINPIRTDWSAKYSDYEPPAGSINFEDIYDPRFNSYAAEERAYSDINLGQVRYWYSDIDAYKMPNFIQRSNVDFVEYTTPQGQVWPEYNRTATLDEIRNKVESQTTADEVYHREDMMENLMSKMNRMNWQLRQAPLSRAAHSNMGFGPSS
jgi:hypothetical protein